MLLFLGGKLSSILEYINTYFQSYYYFKFSEMIRVKEESSSISSLKDEFTQRIAENTLTASEASETNAFPIFKRLFMSMLEIERLVMIPSPSIKYF